ncbi:MAG: PAS domain S-box protein [Nitrospirota bacterium]|nr:PAS domain S-box protein [Nitrospirota bacterium]MDP2383970.1 PAS domain S-box protein [Nitrospirota bacterium]MDP3596120.1 PAS domain S-box protein [Nitrospirota bacterium]
MSVSQDRTNLPFTELAHLRALVAQLEQKLAVQECGQDAEQRVRERAEGLEQAVADLEAEVARRTQVEATLKANEQQYQTLYDDNPSMYFTLSHEGTVLSVNAYGAEQLGYSKKELTNHSVLRVFDPQSHQAVLEQLSACAASPSTLFHWEIQKIRKDGTRLWVKERARAIQDGAGKILILVVCDDITLRKQVESTLHESEQAIRSLQAATSAPGLTFEQRMQTVLELGCLRFRMPIGVLTRVVGDYIELNQVWPATGNPAPGALIPLSQSFCSATLQTEGPLCFEHAGSSDWRHHPGYAALGIESYIGTKLLEQHRVYGTVCFFGPDPYPGTFSEADKDFLQLMARWISGELDRRQTEQRLRKINECFLEFGSDPLANINRLTALAGELLGGTCALYSRLEGELLCSIGQWQTPPDFNPVDQAKGHLCCDLIQQGEKHLRTIRHLAETSYATTDPNVGRFRLETYVGKVVTRGQESVGSLCIVFQHDFIPTEADERFIGILASAIETEEARILAQEALRVSEERFAKAFQLSPHPIILTEFETGRCLEVNDAALTLFGYQRDEAIGQTVLSLGLWPTPEDRARYFQQLQNEGSVKNRELGMWKKDRTAIYLLVSSERITLNGTPCLITVGHDITDRKQAELALRITQCAVDRAADMVFWIDTESRFVNVNDAACQRLGYSREELLSMRVADIDPDHQTEPSPRLLEELRQAGQLRFETRHRTKNGEIYPVEIVVNYVAFEGQELNFAFARDISERKLAEEALRTSEVQWRQFVANAPVGLVIMDNHKRLLSANKAFCALTGYSEREVVGNTYALYTHPDDLPDNLALTNAFFEDTRSSYTYEKRYIRKTGDMIWVSVTTTGIELPGQTGPLLLAVVKDISERMRVTEERERISQDLHDGILQSLYAVGMGLEHTRQRVKRTSPTNARRLDTSVAQLNDVIREVRSFIPRMQAPAIQHGAFDQALLAIVQSLAVAGAGDIELAIDKSVAEGLSHTQCGPVLSIAKEAMSNSLRHAGAAHRRVTVQLYRGKFRLEVSDDGEGFRPTARKSSGLGLANMRARARKLGARLTIRSRPGQGTQVVLNIPLPAPQATA